MNLGNTKTGQKNMKVLEKYEQYKENFPTEALGSFVAFDLHKLLLFNAVTAKILVCPPYPFP